VSAVIKDFSQDTSVCVTRHIVYVDNASTAPIQFVEILRTWERKVQFQCHVMMFLVDYPSSSHRKLNHRTSHLRPIASCAPVHLAVLPVVRLRFSRTEASLGPTLLNIHHPYIHINTREGDPISSILALTSLPLSHNAAPWILRRGWLPVALRTVFLRRSSPSSPSRWLRLQRLRSKTFVVYVYATRRRRGRPQAALLPIASTSSITTRPQFGVATR
jgi:hypothetical protein